MGWGRRERRRKQRRRRKKNRLPLDTFTH